ncbi:MAG: UPF0182 family protein [Synergistaceae bacterium]|nr:UPF0182 family protein [Synergistaceae bacterium]
MINTDDFLRRLFKAEGKQWREGNGDNDSGWDSGAGNGGMMRGRIKFPRVALAALLLVLVVTLCFSGVIDFYTDLLWFSSHGLSSVLWRRILPQVALFAVGLTVTFAVYNFNWRRAARIGNDEFRSMTGLYDAILVRPLYVTIFAALISLFSGFGANLYWPVVLQFLHRVPFGETDAVFGMDVGFYVFTLPFVHIIQKWLANMALFSLLGSAVIYLLCKALRSEGTRIVLVKRARLHLFALSSFFIFLVGIGLWLSRYELLYSPTGIVYGVGYTDFYVRLPALAIISLATVAASMLLLVNFFRPMWKLSAILLVLLLVAGFLAYSLIPSIVQNYIVKPNEYEREKHFIDNHIRATRHAFAFDKITTMQMTPMQEVSISDMDVNSETVENIRLWDYSPLLRTYKQLQEIRTYYDFADIDIDRYKLDGKNRQVMLSVRELDLGHLQNPTWVNTHLEFTHGYGVVMNPVNEIEESGLPVFFMKDLPPRTTVPIVIDRPQIYFGEKPNEYALVKTDVNEFDYPTGDSNSRSTYDGTGGVEVGSLLRRILFAIKFRDSEILFTGAIRPESMILLHRNVRESIREIAPFLILEEDIYPVIIDGHILWIQDAYTVTDLYPYSSPMSRQIAIQSGLAPYSNVNYIRNSVKITVDAYDGTMNFYTADREDPILKSWSGVFPELFKPVSEAPEEVLAHFRYPEEYFEVQSEIYRTYHMTDTNTYYNREDVWMTTPQGQDRRIRPNYVTMQLLDEGDPEFALIAPFMPFGRNNLIGWMAARCDVENYGELIVYQFPKQELVFGPSQIEALIDQNTVISSQISLWSQRGSDVIRGDLLVIPIGKSLLYVQPLYLRAERGDLPELKRIILSTGGRVAWGETFDKAVTELFGVSVMPPPVVEEPVSPPETPTQEKPELDEALLRLAKDAKEHYDKAQKAIKSGDWTTFGIELDILGEILEAIAED